MDIVHQIAKQLLPCMLYGYSVTALQHSISMQLSVQSQNSAIKTYVGQQAEQLYGRLINDVNQSLLRTLFLAPRGESAMLHATRLRLALLIAKQFNTAAYSLLHITY